MTVQDIVNILEEHAPFATAEDWDNSGLLVGDAAAPVTKVIVALDATDAVIDLAIHEQAELIVTHHPVIFDPLTALPADSTVYRLAQAGIAVISAHTNADKAVGGVNDCLCEALGLSHTTVTPDGLCRIGTLPANMSAAVFADYVAQCLCTAVRLKAGTDEIRTVAVCGGAGADLVIPLLREVDAAVTGEVKHHEWLSVPSAKTLADGGHYATEVLVVDRMADWIQTACSTLNVIPYHGEAPYQTIKE